MEEGMATVTISMPDSLKAFVEEQVRTRGYGNVSEYFRELVRAAQERAADERATERILDMLGVGSPTALQNPRLRGLRSWPVPGFEAVRLYYLETEDTIRIVRVLHGMQDVGTILESDESA